jgi:hypothetical protein
VKPGTVLVAGLNGTRYTWPGEPDLTVPRVTAIVGALGSKEYENLAAKQVARKAVLDDTWRNMADDQAISWLEQSRWEKANFGTDVHRIIAEWLDEPTLEITGVEPDHLNYLTGAIAFLNHHASRIVHVEKTLFNRTYEYAGTADLVAKMKDGSLAVIDWKTGNVYPEHSLQLTAYMNCELVAGADGHLAQLAPINKGYVVQLPGDGTYKAHEFNPSPRAFRTFIALRSIQKWRDEHQANAFDSVLEPIEDDVATTN